MKYILLLSVLVSLTYCATTCGETKPSTSLGCLGASKADDCYCCYLKGTPRLGSGTVTKCVEVYKSSIDDNNVYNYIKYYLGVGYASVDTFYCKSSYLAVGLLTLIGLLF